MIGLGYVTLRYMDDWHINATPYNGRFSKFKSAYFLIILMLQQCIHFSIIWHITRNNGELLAHWCLVYSLFCIISEKGEFDLLTYHLTKAEWNACGNKSGHARCKAITWTNPHRLSSGSSETLRIFYLYNLYHGNLTLSTIFRYSIFSFTGVEIEVGIMILIFTYLIVWFIVSEIWTWIYSFFSLYSI